ncbi:MAG: hypothetical protein R2788_10410 [Saprospiraceae bacterium]
MIGIRPLSNYAKQFTFAPVHKAFMKFTAYILASLPPLLGSFIPRTDFSQLLRLKDLQEHYQLHCQEAEMAGKEVCLQEFLYDHFIEHNDHEHAEKNGCSHEGLPMHSLHHFCSDGFRQMHDASGDYEIKKAFSIPAFKNEFHPSIFLSVIDQPPC